MEVANDWKEADIMLSSEEGETEIVTHLSLRSVSIACLHHHQNVLGFGLSCLAQETRKLEPVRQIRFF